MLLLLLFSLLLQLALLLTAESREPSDSSSVIVTSFHIPLPAAIPPPFTITINDGDRFLVAPAQPT